MESATGTLTSPPPPPPQPDWKKERKNIFILSSAGKPVYTRHGDENEMVTLFGLLQAVVSIAQDAGDQIHSINLGTKRIIFFLKNALYFVCVTTTKEPEIVCRQQLEFIHDQILFVLTNKVHYLLEQNASRDLRDLLGTDTNKFIQSSCQHEIVSPCVVLRSVKGFVMETSLREDLRVLLKLTIDRSNAAVGCLLHEDSCILCLTNEKMNVNIHATDLQLLAQFVHNSPSLRSNEQNWVPLCLPNINAGGYLQAYIAFIRMDDGQTTPPIQVAIVLISASDASVEDFKLLHEARLDFQNSVSKSQIPDRVAKALTLEQIAVENYLQSVQGIHFFYKFSPPNGIPPQCVWSTTSFPNEYSAPEMMNKIWTQYYRLAVCVRRGSSTPECTLLEKSHIIPDPVTPGKKQLSGRLTKTDDHLNENTATSSNPLHNQPSSDHALAYSIMEDGIVAVGLATSDSELYVAFPSTVSALDACGLANFLTRNLKKEAGIMFQV